MTRKLFALPKAEIDQLETKYKKKRFGKERARGSDQNAGWYDRYLYHVPVMHGNNPPDVESAARAFPSRCPRCDADWGGSPIGSPIRTQRTGFQKIAQILSDSLLRFIGSGHGAGVDSRKLVLFSDSRQDAAKLSAGMNMAHYLDALRQAEHDALIRQGAGHSMPSVGSSRASR